MDLTAGAGPNRYAFSEEEHPRDEGGQFTLSNKPVTPKAKFDSKTGKQQNLFGTSGLPGQRFLFAADNAIPDDLVGEGGKDEPPEPPAQKSLFAKGEFREEEHPREDTGKFTSKGHATSHPGRQLQNVDNETYGGPRWTYGFQNRPPGYGHNPEGFISGSQKPHPSFNHGTIDYPHPLTHEEQESYELSPAYHKGQLVEIPNTGPMNGGTVQYLGEKDGLAWVGYPDSVDANDSSTWRTHRAISMPKESLHQFFNDLSGVVDIQPSKNLYVDAVRRGEAEFLGKGHEEIAFGVGDKVIKFSTTVPYHPIAHLPHRSPDEAVDMLGEDYANHVQMRKAGIPGILPQKVVMARGRRGAGDKAALIMDRLDTESKLNLHQLMQVRDSVMKAHENGWVFGDQLQVGIGPDGRAWHYDIGFAEKTDDKHKRQEDLENLHRLFMDHDQKYVPIGKQAEDEFDHLQFYVEAHADDPPSENQQKWLRRDIDRADSARKAMIHDNPSRKSELNELFAQRIKALGMNPGDWLEGYKPQGKPKQKMLFRKQTWKIRYAAGSPQWVSLGGARALVDDDGKILMGCPGLEGNEIDTLDETADERAAEQEQAEDSGWESAEQQRARDTHDAAREYLGKTDQEDFTVLVRLGDKIYSFGDGAKKLLDVTNTGDGDAASFNVDNLDHHISKLVGAGHRVAVVDREEDGDPTLDSEADPQAQDAVEEQTDEAVEDAGEQAGQEPWQVPFEKMLTRKEADRHHRDTYFDDSGGGPIASTRTTPSNWADIDIEPGTWLVDSDFDGNYGHMIEQYRMLDPHALELAEDDYFGTSSNVEGRGDDARRYAEWMEQGLRPPPIAVAELPDGTLRVMDGHRRTAAAKFAGKPVPALVSPTGYIDKLDSEGQPIAVPMTYELALRDALREGQDVPQEVIAAETDRLTKQRADVAPLAAQHPGSSYSEKLDKIDAMLGLLAGEAAQADIPPKPPELPPILPARDSTVENAPNLGDEQADLTEMTWKQAKESGASYDDWVRAHAEAQPTEEPTAAAPSSGGPAVPTGQEAADLQSLHQHAAKELAEAPVRIRGLLSALHGLRDTKRTGKAETRGLNPEYARAVYDHLRESDDSDEYGELHDLSDQLGQGAIGYHTPAGNLVMIPPIRKKDDWQVRYMLPMGESGELGAVEDDEEPSFDPSEFGDTPQPDKPRGVNPNSKFGQAIIEAVGEDPQLQDAFAQVVNEMWAQKQQETAQRNDSLRNLLSNFGYSGRDMGAFVRSVQKYDDADQFIRKSKVGRRFDQMVEMAARDYPELLAYETGEMAGANDAEYALFSRLKTGLEQPPAKHSEEVIGDALGYFSRFMEGYDPDAPAREPAPDEEEIPFRQSGEPLRYAKQRFVAWARAKASRWRRYGKYITKAAAESDMDELVRLINLGNYEAFRRAVMASDREYREKEALLRMIPEKGRFGKDGKTTICVDLDGVLAKYDGWKGVEHIGDPIDGAREFLTQLRDLPAKVVIYTTRVNASMENGRDKAALTQLVADWLDKHDLPYDEIAEDDGKPPADAYLDDRAITVQPQLDGDAFENAMRELREGGKLKYARRRIQSSPGQLDLFGGPKPKSGQKQLFGPETMQPGITKNEGGKTYVLNDNHRWELHEPEAAAAEPAPAAEPAADDTSALRDQLRELAPDLPDKLVDKLSPKALRCHQDQKIVELQRRSHHQ